MAHGCNESFCPVCLGGLTLRRVDSIIEQAKGVDWIRSAAGLTPTKHPCAVCGGVQHGEWFKRTRDGAAAWFCMTHGGRLSRIMRRKVLKAEALL